jgi:hypothetical protein
MESAQAIEKIELICKDARIWTEHLCIWSEKNMDLFDGCCFDRDDCGESCAVAATHLALCLNANGIAAYVTDSNIHAFCVYRQFVIDVTATQFKLDPIVILPIIHAKELKFDDDFIYKSTNKKYLPRQYLKYGQNTADWPDHQKASNKHYQKFLGKPYTIFME